MSGPGGNGGGGMWPDYGYISCIEATGFVTTLDIRYEGVGPSNWKNEFPVF